MLALKNTFQTALLRANGGNAGDFLWILFMDDLPPDLEDPSEDGETHLHDAMCQCKCGRIFSARIPCICECGETKPYWRTIDGRMLHLSKMTLGHLNNAIRHLATKAELYPPSLRGSFEIALDILYAELGSRDKEITQSAGILAALVRKIETT